jgi:hypothetical protein
VSNLTILHGGALGDLALTLHLALRLPIVDARSTLTLVSRTNPGDLSDCRPSVQRLSSEGMALHWLYCESRDPPPGRLRAVVAGQLVLNALGGAESVVHRQLEALDARAVHSFDPRPDPESDTHILRQWQRQLEGQGLLFPKCIHQHRGGPRLVVSDEMRERGRDTFAKSEVGGSPILIHPGSGGRAKCWPLRCFLDAARLLRAEGRDVCFVVGPVELERWPADDLQTIRAGFPLLESLTADELLSVLAAANTLIGNDAGPAQLAALLGTATVTIFGPTSPAVWRPLGSQARVVVGRPGTHSDDWGTAPSRVLESLLPA